MPVYSMTGYASAQQSAAARRRKTGTGSRAGGRRAGDALRQQPLPRPHLPPARGIAPARTGVARNDRPASCKRGKVEVRASRIENPTRRWPHDRRREQLQRLNALQDNVRPGCRTPRALSVATWCCSGAAAGGADRATCRRCACRRRATASMALATREREGARLAAMLLDHLQQLRELAAQAAPLVPQLVERQQQRFLERWNEAMALAGGHRLPKPPQDRALTEATAFAIRIDVAEELTRLSSHIDEIERLVEERRRDRQAAGLPDPGAASRGQHAGLEVGGAGAHQHLGRHEGADRADARAGAEHRVTRACRARSAAFCATCHGHGGTLLRSSSGPTLAP